MKSFWIGMLGAAAVFAAGSTMAASGADVYKGACAVCHDTGVGGAPKLGNKTEWAPRIKQGKEALYTVSLKGKPGTAMVAKGGRTDLSDADVKGAVDFMIDKAK